MSAAPRSIQADAGLRQLRAAFAAAVLAAALLLALAYGQLAGSKSTIVPMAGAAPVTHDHGWSSAPSKDSDTAPAGNPNGGNGSGGSNGTRFAQ